MSGAIVEPYAGEVFHMILSVEKGQNAFASANNHV